MRRWSGKRSSTAEDGGPYGDLPEALVQHGHQQLGQHDDHHDVVGANDQGTHEGAQLFRVADPGDEERDVGQGEDVPEQGVAGPHKPMKTETRVTVVPI